MATKTYFHIKVTLNSSTVDRLKELAEEDRRSVGNYVQLLIERDQRRKETGLTNEA